MKPDDVFRGIFSSEEETAQKFIWLLYVFFVTVYVCEWLLLSVWRLLFGGGAASGVFTVVGEEIDGGRGALKQH